MNYCTSCGEKLSDQQAFCTSCGKKRDSEPTEQVTMQAKQVAPTKKPMSKKAKLSWTIGGAVAGVLIIAHFIISASIDPMKQVQAMDSAMTDRDADSFFENVQLDESALLHKEEFMGHIEDQGWESVRNQMTDVIKQDAGSDFDVTITGVNGAEIFILKKESIVPKLYHTYKVEAKPESVEVTANLGPATLSVDDRNEKIENAEEDQVMLQMYPGIYELSGKTSTPFGEFAVKKDVEIYAAGDDMHYLSLDFPESTYGFDTNQPDATLFINGESTEKTLSEFDELGPFPEEEEVVMYAEWTTEDGKTLQSEPFTQFDRTFFSTYSFHFEETTAVKEASVPTDVSSDPVEQHVLDFRNAYEKALNTIDYGKIAPYLLEGSQAEEDLSEYIGDLEDEGYNYDFTDNRILSVESIGDDAYLVRTNEKFIFTNHRNDETFYDREKDYYVRKLSDSYKIYQIDISETDRNNL
ncbi:TcaA NTF2-like domain-containing protein [Halobacillus salinus]|uniref:TcaA NTF2-like domain-containing protein n=1 Tax=Halobacillus salinus TaxID=192814 RepID=UPI0009A83EA4|nr:hypothetical protein [Halobacillus salinus]